MTDPQEHDPLEEEELERQDGEPLPDREVMSTIDFNPGPFPYTDPAATLPNPDA